MKIITIRDEKAYTRNQFAYGYLYAFSCVFAGAAFVLVMQGHPNALAMFLGQLMCGVWWKVSSIERKKLMEVKNI